MLFDIGIRSWQTYSATLPSNTTYKAQAVTLWCILLTRGRRMKGGEVLRFHARSIAHESPNPAAAISYL